jgi:hypothetical protein
MTNEAWFEGQSAWQAISGWLVSCQVAGGLSNLCAEARGAEANAADSTEQKGKLVKAH